MTMSKEANEVKKTLLKQLNAVNSDTEMKNFMIRVTTAQILAMSLNERRLIMSLQERRENARKL